MSKQVGTGVKTSVKATVSSSKGDDGCYHVLLESAENSDSRTYITAMKMGADSMVENIQRMIDDGCEYDFIVNVVNIVLKRALANG